MTRALRDARKPTNVAAPAHGPDRLQTFRAKIMRKIKENRASGDSA
jgi:hypothetical protein